MAHKSRSNRKKNAAKKAARAEKCWQRPQHLQVMLAANRSLAKAEQYPAAPTYRDDNPNPYTPTQAQAQPATGESTAPKDLGHGTEADPHFVVVGDAGIAHAVALAGPGRRRKG
ncbi:MAG TPA: hypothetical protein VM529_15920 [Gemmata sp.]|jgi:hypothetical protein|nr:hypothetical protein [Gemmata sp.]